MRLSTKGLLLGVMFILLIGAPAVAHSQTSGRPDPRPQDAIVCSCLALQYNESPSVLPPAGTPPDPTSYDEQMGMTFTQSFTAMAYNVTAVEQTDPSSGTGPAYFLNGLSDQGYWYQVGLSWNWDPGTGFDFFYEVWNSTGSSIFPSNGGGGLLDFSGPVNAGDTVLLNLYFSTSNGVVMLVEDYNTGAYASETYSAEGATYFVGLPSSTGNSYGMFTGLMTEWYHPSPYYSNEAEVIYSNPHYALTSGWMWIDEFSCSDISCSNRAFLFDDYTPAPVSYNNPTQLQRFASNGATEYSDAYEFVTGALGTTLTISYLVQGGGSGYSPPVLTYSLNGVNQNATLSTSQSVFNVDPSSTWTVNSILGGSTSSERWQTDQVTSGIASSPQIVTLVYYHQFFVSFSYVVIGGGAGYSSPSVTFSQFGVGSSTNAGSSVWVDASSVFSYPNLLPGSSSTESWRTNQQSSGEVSSSNPVSISYYHQFFVSFGYIVAGGGIGYSAPSVVYRQFGANLSVGTGSGVWADAQSSYAFQAQLQGSSASERWSARSPSGTVSSAGQMTCTYDHQFLLTVVGGGSKSRWFDSGLQAVYTTPRAFGRHDGTGSRIVSYSLDAGPAIATEPSSGNVTVSMLMNAPHSMVFDSVTQYQVNLDSSSSQALDTITSPTIPGDDYWYDAGSPVSLVLNGVWNRGTDTGYRLASYSANGVQAGVATSGAVQVFTTDSLTSPEFVTAVTTVQYLLSTPSGSLVSVTPPQISGDTGWYDSGTPIVIAYNNVWNVVANQSRLNAIGYAVDDSTTTITRSGSGTFSVGIVMDALHSVTVSSITQYSLAISGGSDVKTLPVSPTGDSFYDSGSAPTVTTAYTWGVTGGNTRQNLLSFTLDGSTTNVTRAESGNFTTPPITLERARALAFNSVTQYLVSFQFKDGTGSDNITPTALQIEVSAPTVMNVSQLEAWLDADARFQIVSVTWENENVRPVSNTVYTVGGPVEETILARAFNARLVVTDYLGIAISGARVSVTLANGTSIQSTTGGDGAVNLGLIPLGTFHADISYLGASTAVTGDASTTPVTTGRVFASYPTFALIVVLVIAAVGGFLLYRRSHHHTSSLNMGPERVQPGSPSKSTARTFKPRP